MTLSISQLKLEPVPEREEEAAAAADLSRVEGESVVGEGGGEPGEGEDQRAFPDSGRPDHGQEGLVGLVVGVAGGDRRLSFRRNDFLVTYDQLVTKPLSLFLASAPVVVLLDRFQNSRQISKFQIWRHFFQNFKTKIQ